MGSVVTQEGAILAGKYRVERVLGEGGMGIVVKATHLELEQAVALKFLQPEALEKTSVVERFAREAKALAKLKSEHVAHVIDVGKLEDGSPYIVMEYLDGEDLASLLDRAGALPIEEAIGYLLEASEAIAEAHAGRIVHRDLKPANLFLAKRASDKKPTVKVLDFGISKVLDDEVALTKTSAGLGSAQYMAPEQMRNAKNCDERADLWALGVILYELLTGCVPFEGESVHEVVANVLELNRKKLSDRVPTIPKELEALVDACLVLDPKKRIGSIVEFAERLVPFGPPGSEESLSRIRRVLSVDESSSVPTRAAPRAAGSGRDLAEMAIAKTEAQGPTAAAHTLSSPGPSDRKPFPVLPATLVFLAFTVGVGVYAYPRIVASKDQATSTEPAPSSPRAGSSAVSSAVSSGGPSKADPSPSTHPEPSAPAPSVASAPVLPPKKVEKPTVSVASAVPAPVPAPVIVPAPPTAKPTAPSNGIVPISTMGIK